MHSWTNVDPNLNPVHGKGPRFTYQNNSVNREGLRIEDETRLGSKAVKISKKLNEKEKQNSSKKKAGREMEEDNSSSSANLETSKADKSVWLMKCPVVVAKSWKNHTSPSSSDSAPLAKVVLSLDPLQSDDPSALQVLFVFSICAQCLIFFLIIRVSSFNSLTLVYFSQWTILSDICWVEQIINLRILKL